MGTMACGAWIGSSSASRCGKVIEFNSEEITRCTCTSADPDSQSIRNIGRFPHEADEAEEGCTGKAVFFDFDTFEFDRGVDIEFDLGFDPEFDIGFDFDLGSDPEFLDCDLGLRRKRWITDSLFSRSWW